MCGIVAIADVKNCIPKLVSGLQALEYRGYDSSGIASSSKNRLVYQKSVGKISQLVKKLKNKKNK